MLYTGFSYSMAFAEYSEGIFAVSMSDGVVAVPQFADKTAVEAVSAEIPQGIAVLDLYPGAQRFSLSCSNDIQADAYYLIMVIKGYSLTPTSENVVYVDQITASGGIIQYNIYPISLEIGETYHVCLSTNADTENSLVEIGSFQYGKDMKAYSINFFDEDGITILGTSYVYRGEVPEYPGEMPAKVPTEESCYIFSGWNPVPTAVTGETSYRAVYTANAHSYGEPAWSWANDYSTATATFVCSIGGETKVVNATVGEPEEKEDGSKAYTATAVLQGVTYTDIKVVENLPEGNYALFDIDGNPATYIDVIFGKSRQLIVVNMDTGESVDHANALIWESDNPDVATIDENGTITAIFYGVTTFSARTTDERLQLSGTVHVIFEDVDDFDRYYYEAVYWAVDNGITVGYGGPGLFSPNAPCTREQIVTMLWNMMGKPEPTQIIHFTDVESGKWYEKAISWAAENGITVGLNDGTGRFGIGQPCTREMCVAFLHRAVGSPDPDTYQDFTDVDSARYYYVPISWAAENGITVGLNDGTGRFGVGQFCTRGMVISFLYRFSDLT